MVEAFIFIAYVAGTYMGYRFGKGDPMAVIGATIDKLAKDGYIRTQRGEDGEMELLKYWETPKEVDSNTK